jgi:DNA modification methylase
VKVTYDVLVGDNRETIKSLPDQSVNTVVTSPPYFGLRDYGTATWEGGSADCNHMRDSKVGDSTSTGHKGMDDKGHAVGDAIYKDVCKKCGAVRKDSQIGLEETPEDYVQTMVELFREIRRVLRDDGTVWLNIGDSYAGSGKGRNSDGSPNVDEDSKQATSKGTTEGVLQKMKMGSDLKQKDLIGIPWMLAFALRADGWYLRQDIIWSKPNPMPESVKDRCTKAHEYIFLLSKSKSYYYDYEAIKEEATGERWGGDTPINMNNTKDTDNVFSGLTRPRKMLYDKRNKRSVWTVTPKAFKGAHFATFPPELIEPCILAGCPEGGTVLDPFGGSGTTAGVAYLHDRNSILCELNPEYAEMVERRIEGIIEGKRTLGATLPL